MAFIVSSSVYYSLQNSKLPTNQFNHGARKMPVGQGQVERRKDANFVGQDKSAGGNSTRKITIPFYCSAFFTFPSASLRARFTGASLPTV